MKINKQLFENVLSGKLKGTFVLRNGDKWAYWYLKKPNKEYLCDYYELNFQGEVVYDYRCLLFEDNGRCNTKTISPLDIVDFIPDTKLKNSMKTKELKIKIPDGYEIDPIRSSFEKIVFKKKENTNPKKWKEYNEQRTTIKRTNKIIFRW